MRMPLMSNLKYTVGRHLPFLKINPPVDRAKVFHLRPLRHPEIEWSMNDDQEALLTIPHRTDRMGRVLSFWFKIPEARGVQLDEVGTFVWNLCDGSHTVEGIVKETCRQYKMNRREVEISVTTYLQMLAERRFIGFFQRGGKNK